MFSLEQHVHECTYALGGTLDVIIFGTNHDALSIDVEEVGFSDHHLVSWSFDINQEPPQYVTVKRHAWKNFDVSKFKLDLLASDLCTSTILARNAQSVDELVGTYDETLTRLLDQHAPFREVTRRRRLLTHGMTPSVGVSCEESDKEA